MTDAALLNTVRAHGLRVSARAAACSTRCSPPTRPLTAEEIAGGGDVASIYRNLETLETIGIVRHVHLGHGPGRYALSSRSGAWASCEACGRSTPIEPKALQRIRETIHETCGFDAWFGHFPIVGRCPECISSPRA